MSARAQVDFGYAVRPLRWRWVSGLLPVRLVVVSGVLAVTSLAAALAALTLGDYPLPLPTVLGVLTGGGEAFERTIVLEWRLPIALAAVVFGALLGVGGAVFQSLTRNPLGSPDVIGFDAGSYFGVVVTLLVVGAGSYLAVAGSALAGGLLAALAVYALAYRRGVQGFRLIIVGIGVSAMLGSANAYLITRAELDDALTVGFWGAGSIGRVTWDRLLPSVAIAVVILLCAALLSPALRRLELGDDVAVTHGVRPGRARLALLVTGVATVALVTAAAGPIGFVALAAPQLARRLTRSAGVSLVPAAAMGAVLLSGAHLLSLSLAQVYRAVPVGLVTVCLGGTYLIWLLVRESRRQEGVLS